MGLRHWLRGCHYDASPPYANMPLSDSGAILFFGMQHERHSVTSAKRASVELEHMPVCSCCWCNLFLWVRCADRLGMRIKRSSSVCQFACAPHRRQRATHSGSALDVAVRCYENNFPLCKSVYDGASVANVSHDWIAFAVTGIPSSVRHSVCGLHRQQTRPTMGCARREFFCRHGRVCSVREPVCGLQRRQSALCDGIVLDVAVRCHGCISFVRQYALRLIPAQFCSLGYSTRGIRSRARSALPSSWNICPSAPAVGVISSFGCVARGVWACT